MGWFTGSQYVGPQKRTGFWYRNQLFIQSMPVALISALLSLIVGILRRTVEIPELFDNLIDHQYAAQVFGVVVGYLVVMRVTASLSRWDNGMEGCALMSAKWSDAQGTFLSFCHAERTCGSPLSQERMAWLLD